LKRRFWGKDTGAYKWSTTQDDDIESEKIEGIAKHSSKNMTIEMRIPAEESYG